VFFPSDLEVGAELVAEHWLASADGWGAGRSAQHVTPLWGLPGWLQYQAKHSSRGVRHYQRASVPEAWQNGSVPEAWQKGTGRLWGVVGEWPTREEAVDVDLMTFWRFRRLMRGWMLGQARQDGDDRRAAWVRGMLRDPDEARSRVRALGEFCPESTSRLLLHAAATGPTSSDPVAAAWRRAEGAPPPGARSGAGSELGRDSELHDQRPNV